MWGGNTELRTASVATGPLNSVLISNHGGGVSLVVFPTQPEKNFAARQNPSCEDSNRWS